MPVATADEMQDEKEDEKEDEKQPVRLGETPAAMPVPHASAMSGNARASIWWRRAAMPACS